MPEPADWSKWHAEQEDFKNRETKGFTEDEIALKALIKVLKTVCPKDEAGVPVTTARNYLDRLLADFNRFKEYLDLYAK